MVAGTGIAERVGMGMGEGVGLIVLAVGLGEGVALTALTVGDSVTFAAVGVSVGRTVGVRFILIWVGEVGVIVIFVTAALGDVVLRAGGVLVLVFVADGGRAMPLPV
jgi:hypothetical protein